jgi:hypothetical protein
VSDRSGKGLMTAGAIVALIGLCVILVRVLKVPEYYVPLMVGIGLFLVGLLRWLTSKGS